MAKTSRHPKRLPKAPLAEVVFELHWKLQAPPGTPDLIRADPGLLPLIDAFTAAIKKAGYPIFKDMSPPLQTAAHSIVRRYFRAPDSAFPIMQIGPGIFATNESSLYEWGVFKKQVDRGLRVLLDSYPALNFFKIEPSHIELRYIDAFDASLLGTTALLDFIQRGTAMKIELPGILTDSKIFAGDYEGRVFLRRELKHCKSSIFIMDLGSGKSGSQGDIVRMETKIVSKDDGVPQLKTSKKFLSDVGQWLEFAHGITSPLFEKFISDDVMKKFKEP